MSGSGATCFGVFPDEAAAKIASRAIPPTWWRWGGPTFSLPRVRGREKVGAAQPDPTVL
jgi:4-diphosphocytidyl-2C-methyl-D-erythritol kinase